MKSRYDFMDESEVIDTETGESYPDPLSINYNEGKLTILPINADVSKYDLEKFWLFMYNQYNTFNYDDVLLNENNVPYINCLSPGDKLYLPRGGDVTNFIREASNRK